MKKFWCNGKKGFFTYLKEPVVTHWMPLPEPPKEEEE